jgi:hypothetical protein
MSIAVSDIVFMLVFVFSDAGYFRVLCGTPAGTGVLPLNAGYYGTLTDSRNMGEICVPPPPFSNKHRERSRL